MRTPLLGEGEFPASSSVPVGGRIPGATSPRLDGESAPRPAPDGSLRLNRQRMHPYPARVTLDEALAELGIDRDADSDGARRAYLRLLKTRKPETDPEGFMRLRAAYELVKSNVAFLEAFRPRRPAASEPIAATIEPSAEGIEAPVEGIEAPVEGIEAPAEGIEASAEGAAPSAEGAAPSAEGDAPSAEGDAPSGDRIEAPAAGIHLPWAAETPLAEDEEAPVAHGNIAVMQALLARGDYPKAAVEARLILAAAKDRLDRPDPPVLSLLRLMLELHRVAEPATAREVSAAFAAWLAATGQESKLIRGHAAVLWTLVRELDGLKKRLPDSVRTLIARAALDGDLGLAKPALESFRRQVPSIASAAGALMRRKAPVIAAAVADTLDPPVSVEPPFARTARMPPTNSSSGRGIWFILMVIMAVVRILLAIGRSSTPTTYAPSYADPPPAYAKPSEWPSMTDDAGEMDAEMRVALRRKATLRGNSIWATTPSYSPLRPLFGAAVAALDEDDCAKLIDAMKDIRDERTRSEATTTSTRDSAIVLFAVDVARYCSSASASGVRVRAGADAGMDAGSGDAGRHGKTLK